MVPGRQCDATYYGHWMTQRRQHIQMWELLQLPQAASRRDRFSQELNLSYLSWSSMLRAYQSLVGSLPKSPSGPMRLRQTGQQKHFAAINEFCPQLGARFKRQVLHAGRSEIGRRNELVRHGIASSECADPASAENGCGFDQHNSTSQF